MKMQTMISTIRETVRFFANLLVKTHIHAAFPYLILACLNCSDSVLKSYGDRRSTYRFISWACIALLTRHQKQFLPSIYNGGGAQSKDDFVWIWPKNRKQLICWLWLFTRRMEILNDSSTQTSILMAGPCDLAVTRHSISTDLVVKVTLNCVVSHARFHDLLYNTIMKIIQSSRQSDVDLHSPWL